MCAAPICTSPRETYRCTGPNVIPGHEVVGRSRCAGPGHRRRIRGRRSRRHRVAATYLWRVQVLHPRPGEPVPAVALHRLGRRRRIRRIRHGPSGFRAPAAGGILRHRTGAAAVRGHHRLSLPVARRPACRWAARHLRLRRQRAHHRAGGTGAGRRGARDDAGCGGARAWRSRSARRRRRVPTTARRSQLDAAILFAPVGDLVLPALEALDRGGTLAVAGIYLSDIPTLNYERHLFFERQVRSVTSNTRDDAREFLAFAGRHRIAVTSAGVSARPCRRCPHRSQRRTRRRRRRAAV